MSYRSVEWHTDSNGHIKEIAVEYDQTFWQWIFRKPATKKRWQRRGGIEWWSVITEDTMASVENPKEVLEILKALDYICCNKLAQNLYSC